MASTKTIPRLWGEWTPHFYGSGTTIVVLDKYQHKPWLYIYADSATDELRYMRARIGMCHELSEYMNGGERPAWLDDFERLNEYEAKALSGADICATGPMVDSDPPNMNWVSDDSDGAKNDRAKLMDVLFPA